MSKKAVQQIINENGYKRVLPQDAKKGDVVLYVCNKEIVHSGEVIKPADPKDSKSRPMIRSKWGNGALVDHPQNEVPGDYTNGKGGVDAYYFHTERGSNDVAVAPKPLPPPGGGNRPPGG